MEPLLLISHRQKVDDPNYCYFYSLNSTNRIRSIHLPELTGLRCHGFSNGYFLVSDRFAELHILNIYNGARLLPSINTFSDKIQRTVRYPNRGVTYAWQPLRSPRIVFTPSEEMVDEFYKKIFIIPNQRKLTVVVARRDSFRHLAYASPDDERWKEIPASFYVGDSENTDDVVFHKGKLYSSLCGGTVFEIADIDYVDDGPRCIPWAPLVCKLVRPQADHTVSRCYHVESADGEDLMLVWRHSVTKHIGMVKFSLSTFSVFRLDQSGFEWVPVKRLGETAIFLGEGQAVALSTSGSSEVKENCIYFTELKRAYLNWEEEGCRDEGIFHLEDGSISPFFDQSDRIRFRLPLQFWVTMTRRNS